MLTLRVLKTSELFTQECKAGFRLPDKAPLWDWMRDNLSFRDSPYGGAFMISETPWLREPLRAITDPDVEEVWVMSGAQLGKTTMLQGGIAWTLAEDPGPSIVVADSGDALENLAENKINPVLESCEPLARVMPEERGKKKKLKIDFPQCTLMMGPANDSFLRSHSIRYVWGDEVSAWKPGNVQRAKKRTTRWANRKKVFVSTPKRNTDDFSIGWDTGSQEEWHLRCQGCSELISPDFTTVIKWDTNDETKPEGKWDFAKLRETVRLVCPHCGHKHKHTAENARRMNDRGEFVKMNQGANPRVRSFRFTAICLPPAVASWEDLVEEFLRAETLARTGYTTSLEEFINLQLGQPWVEENYIKIKELELDDYDPAQPWESQAIKIMTVDCQEHLADFWVCVRGWARDGSSRLLGYYRPKSFDEVRLIQEQHGVKDLAVFVDRMYKPDDVRAACSKFGWNMLQGEPARDYLISDVRRGAKVQRRRPVSKRVPVSVGRNRPAVPLYRWSNPSIKDMLESLKTGNGVEWLVCDVGEQTPAYVKQVSGERKVEETDRFGNKVMIWKKFRENHALDCECMQIVAAILVGCYGAE